MLDWVESCHRYARSIFPSKVVKKLYLKKYILESIFSGKNLNKVCRHNTSIVFEKNTHSNKKYTYVTTLLLTLWDKLQKQIEFNRIQ